MVKSNKRYKDIRQIEKNKVFQIWQRKEVNFWNKYKSDFVKNSTSDKFNFNKKEEEIDSNKRYKEKQEQTDIYKSRLSIFHSGLRNYLCIVRRTSFFSIKKCKCY